MEVWIAELVFERCAGLGDRSGVHDIERLACVIREFLESPAFDHRPRLEKMT